MAPGEPEFKAMFGIDMAAAADGARRMAEQAAVIRNRSAGPVGRAETPDGRIRLAFSPERGLPELAIDPQAMRMGARELAEAIRRLAGEAATDLARRREGTGDDGAEAAAPDPEAIRRTPDGDSDVIALAARDATALIEQVRDRLQR